ncbi:MAG: hypothetical protein AAGE52_14000 [Myxococcota bacterium]
MDVLLAMLSHDLRNPGTTLVSCLELLEHLVVDADGREAVEDAKLALRQMESAWSRIDALADRHQDRWSDPVDLVASLRAIAEQHRAAFEGPDELTGPEGICFIVDALLEATRRGRVSVTASEVVVTDDRGLLAEDRRDQAFDVEGQLEMKRLGRYSRFAGLVAAKRVAERLSLPLVADGDALFVLKLAPKTLTSGA